MLRWKHIALLCVNNRFYHHNEHVIYHEIGLYTVKPPTKCNKADTSGNQQQTVRNLQQRGAFRQGQNNIPKGAQRKRTCLRTKVQTAGRRKRKAKQEKEKEHNILQPSFQPRNKNKHWQKILGPHNKTLPKETYSTPTVQ